LFLLPLTFLQDAPPPIPLTFASPQQAAPLARRVRAEP
jgi:hypothetical protein